MKIINKLLLHKKILILTFSTLVLVFLLMSKDNLLLKFDLFLHPTDFSQLPSQVESFLTKDDLKNIQNGGFKIYLGNKPPKIEGKYLLNKDTRTFDNEIIVPPWGIPFTDYHYTFKNQTANNLIDWDYESLPNSKITDKDSGIAKGGTITGEGNCFTVFFEGKGVANECPYKMPQILSGCV